MMNTNQKQRRQVVSKLKKGILDMVQQQKLCAHLVKLALVVMQHVKGAILDRTKMTQVKQIVRNVPVDGEMPPMDLQVATPYLLGRTVDGVTF